MRHLYHANVAAKSKAKYSFKNVALYVVEGIMHSTCLLDLKEKQHVLVRNSKDHRAPFHVSQCEFINSTLLSDEIL